MRLAQGSVAAGLALAATFLMVLSVMAHVHRLPSDPSPLARASRRRRLPAVPSRRRAAGSNALDHQGARYRAGTVVSSGSSTAVAADPLTGSTVALEPLPSGVTTLSAWRTVSRDRWPSRDRGHSRSGSGTVPPTTGVVTAAGSGATPAGGGYCPRAPRQARRRPRSGAMAVVRRAHRAPGFRVIRVGARRRRASWAVACLPIAWLLAAIGTLVVIGVSRPTPAWSRVRSWACRSAPRSSNDRFRCWWPPSRSRRDCHPRLPPIVVSGWSPPVRRFACSRMCSSATRPPATSLRSRSPCRRSM